MKITFVIFCGTLFSFQVSAGSIQPLSTWEEAEELQSYLHKQTSEILFGQLDRSYVNMSRTTDLAAQTTMINGAREIKTKCELLVDEYESVKNRNQPTTITKKCAEIYEDQIVDLEAQLLEDLLQCVNNTSSEAVDFILTAASKLFETNYPFIFSTQKWLFSCHPLDEDCLSSYLARARGILEGITHEINSETYMDLGQFKSYLSAIEACGRQHVEIVEDTGKMLLDNFKQCISA